MTFGKIVIAFIAFGLVSILMLGIVLASPNARAETEVSPFKFLVAVLTDANDKGLLSDTTSNVLSDVFIRDIIAPHTGETPEEVRERLISQHQAVLTLLGQEVREQSPFQLLVDVLYDADYEGLLSDDLIDLLATWFVENLIAPHTGETTDQVRERILLSAQPTPIPTPVLTPVVPTDEWSVYKNGVYGYSVSVPTGWALDEDSETDKYAAFWSPDRKGIGEVWGEYPHTELSLQELGEKRLSELNSGASSNSWPIFEVLSERKMPADGIELYEIAFRWQSANEFCVTFVVERIYVLRLYPDAFQGGINPALVPDARHLFARDRSSAKHSYKVGVIMRTGVCELYLDAHTAATVDAFQDSFLVWDRYWDDNYGYGLNIPPGWSVRHGFGSAIFTSPDGSAIVETSGYHFGPHSTIDDLKTRRIQQYREYADTWILFESKGGIQPIGHRVYSPDVPVDIRPEKYLATFRAQVDSQYCVMDYSELMVMSTSHPEHSYGFLVTASVVRGLSLPRG